MTSNNAPERVIAYIDGFNFYHGMMAKGLGRFRWLDYRALILKRIRGYQELVSLKYFTAPLTHGGDRIKRQAAYLRALRLHSGIEPIYGAFEMREAQCQECAKWYKHPKEKLTDVNIAIALVSDAFDDLLDTAYLVCADADLVPAVRMIKERFGKRVVLIDPPRRHSDDLASLADHHWHFNAASLSQAQLPNPVEHERKGKVRRIYRPDEWQA